MARKKASISDLSISEKQSAPLAQRLNDLITDPNALRECLGCSIQAINQYRLGISRPTLENLCKIADYYNVSTDYLMGRTDVKAVDASVRALAGHTGLSEKAVEFLRSNQRTGNDDFILYLVNALLVDDASIMLQSYARAAIRFWLQAYLSCEERTKRQLALEEYRMFKKSFIDIYSSKEISSTVEIYAQTAGDFCMDRAACTISDFLVRVIQEYQDQYKSMLLEARDSTLSSPDLMKRFEDWARKTITEDFFKNLENLDS